MRGNNLVLYIGIEVIALVAIISVVVFTTKNKSDYVEQESKKID